MALVFRVVDVGRQQRECQRIPVVLWQFGDAPVIDDQARLHVFRTEQRSFTGDGDAFGRVAYLHGDVQGQAITHPKDNAVMHDSLA